MTTVIYPTLTQKDVIEPIITAQKNALKDYQKDFEDYDSLSRTYDALVGICSAVFVIAVICALFSLSITITSHISTTSCVVGSVSVVGAIIFAILGCHFYKKRCKMYNSYVQVNHNIGDELRASKYKYNTELYDDLYLSAEQLVSNPDNYHGDLVIDTYPLWVLDMIRDDNTSFKITTENQTVSVHIVNNGFSFETYTFDIDLDEFKQLTSHADNDAFDFSWLDKRYLKEDN